MRNRALARRVGSVILASLLSGCGDDAPLGPNPAPGDPDVATLELVVGGLSDPVLVTHAPGDSTRLFIVEKPGRIRVFRDGSLRAAPFLDVETSTTSGGERGLLGFAFHPEYETNGYFFVNHTDTNGDTRILRGAAASADAADPGSLEIVLEVAQPYTNHNGGHIAFGPDGMLYIGMGDGGDGGDPDGYGQNPASLLGSMLRIDVDALPYTIPPDNPFVGDPSAAPETWAFGLRNPWRWSFDRSTGDLWIGDVGQSAREEISFEPAASAGGANFGWNRLEGTRCFSSDPCDTAGTVLPIYEYGRSDGCSVTGGVVYRGRDIPDLSGRYLFADYCGGWVRSLGFDGSTVLDVIDHEAAFGTVPSISSFGEDARGEVYVVSLGGSIWRIVATD